MDYLIVGDEDFFNGAAHLGCHGHVVGFEICIVGALDESAMLIPMAGCVHRGYES
jgi:hypothetical protein